MDYPPPAAKRRRYNSSHPTHSFSNTPRDFNSTSKRGASYTTAQRGHAEGSGGADGLVLPLTEITGGAVGWSTAYTLPIKVGDPGIEVFAEVDTGSSDLWITSNTCSSEACDAISSDSKYDPAKSPTSLPTNVEFEINYLRGSVKGPIFWDTVSIGASDDHGSGKYDVLNQAFASASTVENEPLTSSFEGLLGLALPLNSVISSKIPAGVGDSADGAVFSSNLFSLTGGEGAPSQRFISLSLSRPGTSKYPALLGLGRHPTQVPGYENNIDELKKKIQYSHVLQQATGTFFWKSSLHKLTVYVDGSPKEITLPTSTSGHTSSLYPSVVYDSGVPLIFTTKAIADGVYGAIGISPSQDGQYYMDCKTPLNISLSLDGRENDIWIHPLDLSAYNSQSTTLCIGLIQSFEPSGEIGDIILGTPFLRNVYFVMGMDEVNATTGNFQKPETTPIDGTDEDDIRPSLGLLALTDPATAAGEWQTVRIEQKPFTDGGSGAHSNGANDPSNKGGISVGIKVLIGLLSFFAMCLLLFGIRWLMMWRRERKDRLSSSEEGGDRFAMRDVKGFFLGGRKTRRTSLDDAEKTEALVISEDDLRQIRFDAHMSKRRRQEESERTLLHDIPEEPQQVGLYGGVKDWESGSSEAEVQGDVPVVQIIKDVGAGGPDVDSDKEDVKSMLTSTLATEGHLSPESLALNVDVPPLPQPISPLALTNNSVLSSPSPSTPPTITPPSNFIPAGAAKPHPFGASARPLSFASLLTNGGSTPAFLSTHTPEVEGQKKLLPSVAPHSPMVADDDSFLSPPDATSLSIRTDDTLSRSSSASTSVAGGGLAGIGSRTRGSFGPNDALTMDGVLMGPGAAPPPPATSTLGSPVGGDGRGSLDASAERGEADGSTTDMYASSFRSGTWDGTEETASVASAKPPSMASVGRGANGDMDATPGLVSSPTTSAPSEPTSTSPHTSASLPSAVARKRPIERPSGPRQSSTGSWRTSSHEHRREGSVNSLS